MPTKIFDVGEMACEDVQSWVRTCKFGTGTDAAFVPADVEDGSFVTLGALCDDAVYTGEKDWNVKHAFAPAANTPTVDDIAVIDIDDRMQGVIGGNNYKIGNKLVDLKIRAGFPVRYRIMKKYDNFWLGAGNFTSTPTVGQFAILTANDTRLTPAATQASGKFCVKVVASKPMVIGAHVPYANSAWEQEYLVEVLS